ncbi:MAG: ring-cleaving dioxygenase [Bacteroidetes bacterium]|nr:ring-cleaving dioxygenase [Bacteroidota bacterium]
MTAPIIGIHHITAMASDAQRNIDFYVSVLGLRLVKRSINQDAPDVYHLYYGDETGTPGTAMTFFPFGRAARGTRGSGEISRVAFAVPPSSQLYWTQRLRSFGIAVDGPNTQFGEPVLTFPDPDGLLIELVFTERQTLRAPWKQGPVPSEHAIKAFYGVTMNLSDAGPTEEVLRDLLGAAIVSREGNRMRYSIGVGDHAAMIDLIADATMPHARQSAGSVHHIAWRVTDDASEEYWRSKVEEHGLAPTEVIDRFYFHSIYFREPGGILYEIATDNPGFTVDEPLESLGSKLVLPPWYEVHRSAIERSLPPIHLPERRDLQ